MFGSALSTRSLEKYFPVKYLSHLALVAIFQSLDVLLETLKKLRNIHFSAHLQKVTSKNFPTKRLILNEDEKYFQF